MAKRVAIIGSRNYPNPEFVRQYVGWLPKSTTVVSGMARGRNPERSVDWIAAQAARELGFDVHEIPADWDGPLGKRAGFDRNFDVVLDATDVAAFWDGWSPGSAHGIALAATAGLLRRVVLPDDLGLSEFRARMLDQRAA